MGAIKNNLDSSQLLEKDLLKMINDHIDRLAQKNFKSRIPILGKDEEVDALAEKLNNISDQLEARESDRKRLEALTNTVIDYSISDFSKKAKLSPAGDEIDALAAGLNVLGEELNFAFETQRIYAADLETSNNLLIENREKIEAIFYNVPNAITACDLDYRITEWNASAEKLYGYTRQEALGKIGRELITSEYEGLNTREKIMTELDSNGSWAGKITQFTSRKPKKVSVICYSSILKDESGNTTGYLTIASDLTQINLTRERLNFSESRYRLLINEIVDYAIIMLDPNGLIVSWNKGAEKIKGYGEDEILGKHFSEFYTEEDRQNNVPEKFLHEAREKGKIMISGWRVRKNRSLFWADVIITKLVDENDNLKGFVKITRDLSDKRRVEEEILQKSEELKRSNSELEQFAYVASHDLQEPLRMITSYVQLLEKNYKDKLDQDASDFINFAVDGAARMQTLIYSLLEFSRINRVKPFENVDLDETLEEVVKDLEMAIHDTKAKIKWEKLPTIYGDKILIGQLFLNLIANAIKFHGKKAPKIKITCKRKNNGYQFSVADNGIGLKPDYKEKIFVIFQRLHSKDKYPGTGIGLAICKKIVERHGGKIWVESEPEKGATFHFTINVEKTVLGIKNGR